MNVANFKHYLVGNIYALHPLLHGRNPDPKLRPDFGQITKLLASNSAYLLSWSEEDKQIGGEDAMKLGNDLETENNLYYDLQCAYK